MQRHIGRRALLALAIAVGVTPAVATSVAPTAAKATSNERGIDPRNLDTSVPACTDFYRHANGGWLARNPVPAERTRWGTFAELDERNLAVLKDILESAAKAQAEPGTNAQRIGDFYASAMDEAAIEKAGTDPIRKDLERIAGLKNAADVAAVVRDWHAAGIPVLFGFYVNSDLKNAQTSMAYASQGGLGLPDRDYYTRTDAESKTLRDKYVAHVARMLELAGETKAAAAEQAGFILALETRLAEASLTRVELRDPYKSYRVVTLADADKETPHFAWSAYFAAHDRADVASFSLSHPAFFAAMDKALAEVPVAQWRAYLRWHLVRNTAPYLSSAFVNESFDFFDKTLSGARELRPRWKRVLDAANLALGEALGELYVERTFPPEAKAKALALIGNVRAALKTRLEKLEWMSPQTRQQALAKLATFVPKIGYPDTWRDYSALRVDRGHWLDNMRAALAFEQRRQVAKVGKPVDRAEWRMNPQRVNAYYNAVQNEIVFPAAILQPPFFDAQADDAVNYGGIGGVIGHEILHGFDDKGSQFDAQGNLQNWWSETDRKQFTERADRLVAHASETKAIGDLAINGKLTLGENIGDLGGLTVAWDAFQLAKKQKKQPTVDGLTPDQRFFYAWAQLWRTNYRDEALKLMVNTDPHAPGPFRVNGPLSNMDPFAKSFACKAREPMVREKAVRVELW